MFKYESQLTKIARFIPIAVSTSIHAGTIESKLRLGHITRGSISLGTDT